MRKIFQSLRILKWFGDSVYLFGNTMEKQRQSSMNLIGERKDISMDVIIAYIVVGLVVIEIISRLK